MVNEQTLCKNGRQAILALAQNVVGPNRNEPLPKKPPDPTRRRSPSPHDDRRRRSRSRSPPPPPPESTSTNLADPTRRRSLRLQRMPPPLPESAPPKRTAERQGAGATKKAKETNPSEAAGNDMGQFQSEDKASKGGGALADSSLLNQNNESNIISGFKDRFSEEGESEGAEVPLNPSLLNANNEGENMQGVIERIAMGQISEQEEIVTKLEQFQYWYNFLRSQNEKLQKTNQELEETNSTLLTNINGYEQELKKLRSRITDLESQPQTVNDTYQKENVMLRQIIAQSTQFRQQILEMLQSE